MLITFNKLLSSARAIPFYYDLHLKKQTHSTYFQPPTNLFNNSSPSKWLAPTAEKSYQMFFQKVTHWLSASAIITIDLLHFPLCYYGGRVGVRGTFAPRTLTSFGTNRCKCDKNRPVTTATITTFATFRTSPQNHLCICRLCRILCIFGTFLPQIRCPNHFSPLVVQFVQIVKSPNQKPFASFISLSVYSAASRALAQSFLNAL